MMLLNVLGPLVVAAATAGQTAEVPTVWAGHQVTLGQKKIPFKGWVQTRTDSYVLARLQPRGDGWRLTQEACKVEFAEVAGVRVSMDVDALPDTAMTFTAGPDGKFSVRSRVRWGSEDLDDDGHPGMTVEVDAPICSGSLYMSNDSRSFGSARLAPRFMAGYVGTQVRQQVLGAAGTCLNTMAKDTNERVAGPFAYVPVPTDTTCRSLGAAAWPVEAMPK